MKLSHKDSLAEWAVEVSRPGNFTVVDADGNSVGAVTLAVVRQAAKARSAPRRTFALPMWPCVHRGGQLGETTCKACGGRRVPLKILACAKHGECTVDRLGDKIGTACCKVCTDRKAE